MCRAILHPLGSNRVEKYFTFSGGLSRSIDRLIHLVLVELGLGRTARTFIRF